MDGNLTLAINFYRFICEIYTQVLVHIRLISVLFWEHIAMAVLLFLIWNYQMWRLSCAEFKIVIHLFSYLVTLSSWIFNIYNRSGKR